MVKKAEPPKVDDDLPADLDSHHADFAHLDSVVEVKPEATEPEPEVVEAVELVRDPAEAGRDSGESAGDSGESGGDSGDSGRQSGADVAQPRPEHRVHKKRKVFRKSKGRGERSSDVDADEPEVPVADEAEDEGQ